ncbi:SDR family NAD(P)-dependent oxidoreductase [Polymorphobacter fuscus]|uniref:SDR family NAD(P)-dependent oxidoreductase n=1 Tax=Sandarakinorhabdus fusca TaxID=1439888 RepID=UPI0016BCFDCC|nr:NAD(P)-dependent dehydrogenase (short-subunit alcohol dehydrogenase family) [Polymorphobacter fuscus]
MNLFDFAGKTVLVTGGSTGIGNAAARGFLAGGARVIVTGGRSSKPKPLPMCSLPI